MTIRELASRLRRAGVPDRFYLLDGGLGGGECVGIERSTGGWSVYYSEHGRKSPLDTCPDEDAACRTLIRHVGRMMREAGLSAARLPQL